jgi:hypothetical protein
MLTDAQDIQAAKDAAEAAQEAADQAASDAAALKKRIDAIDDDGVLDRSEKPEIVKDFQAAAYEHDGLMAQGSAYNVTAERDAYDAAFQSLKAYLEGLSPAYTDYSQDTPISRDEFTNAWVGWADARNAPYRANTGKAGTVADWGGVTGPGKPEDGATVGAPPGTPVGTSTADQVVANLKQAQDDINYVQGLLANLPDGSTIAQQIAVAIEAADVGGNLLTNSDFAVVNADGSIPGWTFSGDASKHSYGRDPAGDGFRPAPEHVLGIYENIPNGDYWADYISDWVPCVAGQWYQGSAYIATQRCNARPKVQWADGNGTFIGDAPTPDFIDTQRPSAPVLESYSRLWTGPVQAPSGAAKMRLDIQKTGYFIDPTYADSWMWFCRPMLAEATQTQTVPTAYEPGGAAASLAATRARVEDVATAAANATGAVAERTGTLEANYGSLSGRVSTVEGVAATAAGRTAAYWQTTAVAGDDRAQLTIYADNGAGGHHAGVNITGNVSIDGNLLVNGSVSTNEIANAAVTRLYYWIAPDVTVGAGEVTLMETPGFWLGDGSYGTGIAVMNYTQDGSYLDVDTAQYIRVYVDTGGGYGLYRSQIQGVRVSGGDARWILPVSFPIPITSVNAVRIKVTAQSYSISNRAIGQGGASYARAIELDVHTGAR